MKIYNSLVRALEFFEEDWLFEIGAEGCKEAIIRYMSNDSAFASLVRVEYQNAMSDLNLNWNQLAIESKLFSNVELYQDWHLQVIVEYYLEEVLFPERALKLDEAKALSFQLKKKLSQSKTWTKFDEHFMIEIKRKLPKAKTYHVFDFKNYLMIELDVLKENRDRLWIVDAIKISN